jgi:nonribosomal peptide synthetase DhbF
MIAEVSAMFAKVLEVPEVAPDDDFFSLGGHSLLAGRLAAEVRRRYGVRIRLADFLESPTPTHVAGIITAARTDGEAQG